MVVIIIQARMGSTRLPGKVLKLIAGRPMLSYQLERLGRCKCAGRIVVATTTQPADDAIVTCETEGIAWTRGSEQDVLSRYDAARAFDATTIVRVTSDCPLIDRARDHQANMICHQAAAQGHAWETRPPSKPAHDVPSPMKGQWRIYGPRLELSDIYPTSRKSSCQGLGVIPGYCADAERYDRSTGSIVVDAARTFAPQQDRLVPPLSKAVVL